MSRLTRTSTRARTIHLNSATYVRYIDDALTNLELGQAGWPETTPGASAPGARPLTECRHPECTQTSPCPTHDQDPHATNYGPASTDPGIHQLGHAPTQQLTPTERLAGQYDKASADLDAMIEHSRLADHHLEAAAAIAKRWAFIGIDDSTVQARLIVIDSELWCTSCTRYGRHEPRKEDRTECDFCSGFRERRFKRTSGGIWQAPPKEIWDARDARNGRLDETTIIRILKQVEADRKTVNAEARKRQRAEQNEAS